MPSARALSRDGTCAAAAGSAVSNTLVQHSASGPSGMTLLFAQFTLADVLLSFSPFGVAVLLGAGHCQAVS
jgi:hypothetical protein